MVDSLVRERVVMLRGIGVKKIITGVGLMCVPIGALIAFQQIGMLPLKLFAITIMIGLYGVYQVLKGCLMVFLPKSESGDVADK